MKDELIDTSHIAVLLGITRAWTTSHIITKPSFPKPVIYINRRVRKWSKQDVLNWAKTPK